MGGSLDDLESGENFFHTEVLNSYTVGRGGLLLSVFRSWGSLLPGGKGQLHRGDDHVNCRDICDRGAGGGNAGSPSAKEASSLRS